MDTVQYDERKNGLFERIALFCFVVGMKETRETKETLGQANEWVHERRPCFAMTKRVRKLCHGIVGVNDGMGVG